MRTRMALLIYVFLSILAFSSICYYTMISSLSIIDSLQLILALIPVFASIGIYLFSRSKYSPRLLFRMSGEQEGDPIPLKQRHGEYLFGVGTDNIHKVIIDEVWVHFREGEISLRNARAEIELTVDKYYPSAAHFKGPWTVVEKHWKGFWLSYEVKKGIEKFSLKFIAKGHIEETEIKFPFDFISPKRSVFQRIARFEVSEIKRGKLLGLKEIGFMLGPKETISVGKI